MLFPNRLRLLVWLVLITMLLWAVCANLWMDGYVQNPNRRSASFDRDRWSVVFGVLGLKSLVMLWMARSTPVLGRQIAGGIMACGLLAQLLAPFPMGRMEWRVAHVFSNPFTAFGLTSVFFGTLCGGVIGLYLVEIRRFINWVNTCCEPCEKTSLAREDYQTTKHTEETK
jgi:hypothetical protein